MSCPHRVVVINLAHRRDRWADTMRELESLGIPPGRIERLDATHISPGYIGCTHSHLRALNRARAEGWPNVLILEDDFKCTVGSRELVRRLKKFFREVPEYDVLMLGYRETYTTPQLLRGRAAVRPWKAGRGGVQRAKGTSASTGAYLVHKRFYGALISRFSAALALSKKDPMKHGKGGGRYACDQFWKPLQTRSEWFQAEPRLAIQRPSYSDIMREHVAYGN